MDFTEGGDLRSLLHLVQRFSEPAATFYAAEIALALQFLHKQGIVHRDLKPDNILLDKEGHIKVSDFGLAKWGMFGETRTKSFCGTPEYMAPEIALRLQYGHEVDWWALGVTIYEMVAGHRPFWPHDDCTVVDSIVYDSIWYPESLSREALSILQGFLSRDRSRRLVDPDDIRSHPFFRPVTWEELEKKRVRPPIHPKPVKTLAAETFLDVEKQVIITWCMAAETFLDVEKQVIITWCKVRTVRKMLENVALVLFEVSACEGGSMRSRTVLQQRNPTSC